MKITSNFTPLWERWDDPGPAVCGAGTRRPSYTYLAGVDGCCTIEWDADDQPFTEDECYDVAQEECHFVDVTEWHCEFSAEDRRAVLTVITIDESSADPDPDHDLVED